MLTGRRAIALFAGVLLIFGSARARGQDDEDESALHRPARLTVGVADQFLGQLAPDGSTLFFLSDRNTTTELFRQDVDEGRAERVFDEGADVTWPRPSPDGKALLYLSYRERAGGQLCVRDLPDADHRRCLADAASALQAEWIDDHRVLLVARSSIAGDLTVEEVKVGSSLRSRTLFNRNLNSPAISPDGRWLVYVPVERAAEAVGPGFAAHAAARLEALRLDRPGAPVPLPVALPGLTGQPAFSRDGYLYFVQFFSDTNDDGVIDGGDRGVLFRLPFPQGRDDAPRLAAAAFPEQLTDANRNCQYPAPAARRLIATCSRGGNLDVYELPLIGEVPAEWSAAELGDELGGASTRADELLLYRHRLAKETDPAARRFTMVRLVETHLELQDFDAADFYARQLAGLHDPATTGLSQPLRLLVEHRRALRDRERGRMVEDFADAEHKRMVALRPEPTDSPAAVFLDHVVRSELAETLGDFAKARAELEGLTLEAALPRSVLDLYYRRADILYRELDDRQALFEVSRRLSACPAFPPEDQLDYARAAAHALVRGLPAAQADAALVRARAAAAPGSELAFALELQQAVRALNSDTPDSAELARVLALFRAQPRLDRKRAVVLEAVQKASALGAEVVIEKLASRYLEASQPGTAGYRRAVRLYRRALVGRAYRRLAEGKRDAARADFEAVTEKTGSFESAEAALELRLRAGEQPEALRAEYARRLRAPASAPLAHFVDAYLLARELPGLRGSAHQRVAHAAMAALRGDWADLKLERSAQALYGAILHEDYLRTGDLAQAERANAHYLVALELVSKNPRYRASILSELGLLQTQVGNFRIALSYLQEREKLPYTDGAGALAVRLARARALLHAGHEAEASAAADEALKMLDANPRLAPYLPLVLDRAALYALAAHRFPEALALYDRELPLLSEGPMAAHNQLLARLGRSAAEVGANQPQRALQDLAEVDRALADPELAAGLSWPFATHQQVMRDYRLLASGLRANASRKLGDLAQAEQALDRERALVLQRLEHSQRDAALRQAILVESELAENALDRHQPQQAAQWAEQAVSHSDALLSRTHADADPAELDALLLGAQVASLARARLDTDLRPRLRDADLALDAAHGGDRAQRTYQSWFEIYRALLQN